MNLTFDENQDRCFSFNSTPPILLQIHRETRELALKTYKQCFGSDSSADSKIWIDFARDIILMSDDYVNGEFSLTQDSDDDGLPISLCIEPELVQSLAFSVDYFCHTDPHGRSRVLNAMVENILDQFIFVKKLYIVYEDVVNPYSQGQIRFFPMERACLPSCDSKGCINVAMIRADCQDSIDSLRKSKQYLQKVLMYGLLELGGVVPERNMDMHLRVTRTSPAMNIMIPRTDMLPMIWKRPKKEEAMLSLRGQVP